MQALVVVVLEIPAKLPPDLGDGLKPAARDHIGLELQTLVRPSIA